MCAKTMSNMEKTQVKMSDFIPNAVSLLRVKLYVTSLLRNAWRARLKSCS